VVDETLLNMHNRALPRSTWAMRSRPVVRGAARRCRQADRRCQRRALLLEARQRRVSKPSPTRPELGCDLIVIGRHGQRGMATLILGSVAEQLAKIADASVLLVRKH
jgi:hypothetical protein